MPKKPDNGNPDKGPGRDNRPDNSTRGQGSGGGDFRQKGGGADRGQGSGASDFRQKGGANRDQGPNVGDYGQQVGAGPDSNSEKSDYLQKVQADKLVQQTKKDGCFPKLFMLLLPFAAAATFLLLRS